MNLLLVHGFWDTGRVFRRLAGRLAAAGHTCFCPELTPRDGRHGLAALAGQLAGHVEARMDAAAPFAVVGFSMGCLVARYYLQQLRGNRRVTAFFAISGPMHGTATAYLYPGQGARDMRYGSRFLRGLDTTAAALAGVQLHTYHTPFDLIILPPGSARLAGATSTRIGSPLHPWMLTNRKLAGDIVQKLARLEPEPSL
jgi:triacylglycerol lipase